MALKVGAKYFRGFRDISLDVGEATFLVGDNSSGKTSILHLLDLVLNTELSLDVVINEGHYASQRDIFSPYFPDKPVYISFVATASSKLMVKSVTAKKGEGGFAHVSACTYGGKDWTITIKERRGSPFLRMISSAAPTNYSDLYSIHQSTADFKKVDFLLRGRRINSDEVAYGIVAESDAELSNSDSVFETLYGSFALPAASFMGPLRGAPERFYKPVKRYDFTGAHFAAMWIGMVEGERLRLSENINQFGQESGLFDKIVIRHLDETELDAPLFIFIEKNGHRFTLDQVGIGVSQVIPILVQSAFMRETKQSAVLLLQQPELHLHPKAQAALGSFLARCVSEGVNFVIETHSDFLIDRFRSHMRDEKIGLKSKIVFCESTPTGNIASSIKIDEKGGIVDPPPAYRNFFRREFARTLF